MKLTMILLVHFCYAFILTVFDLSSASVESKFDDRELPPLVPPKFVDDDDFDERDLDADQHQVKLHLTPKYWAPTLDNLSPGEAEFYRKALINTIVRRDARSMGMLRMGRSTEGTRRSTDGIRRSMTMLRMGRGFDNDEEAGKRSMGMLRMGRRLDREGDFMAKAGRGISEKDENELKRSMGMLRMGRNIEEEEEEAEGKRSMGMLRMGRSYANKNVDRGALNMLRMGKRGGVETEGSDSDRSSHQ